MPPKYPNLERLLESGDITVVQEHDFKVYVGHASDGVEVNLGDTETRDDTEHYLESYPNPTDW